MRDKALHTYLLTAAADYLPAAIDEVRVADPDLHQIMEPDNEIAVVESRLDPAGLYRALRPAEPIFLRHIVPAQSRVILGSSGDDLGTLARQVMEMPEVKTLTAEDTFSVQARVISALGEERPYSPYAIKSVIVPLVKAETGADEDVRDPEIVISILALPTIGFVGVSPVRFNLSDWAGGARRFRREPDQLSRAEFKLLEALEIFGAPLSDKETALDLGAAPGGWTRILLQAGLEVTAVDPAPLDPSLQETAGLEVVQDRAQGWLHTAKEAGKKFDVVVNDIRMDARDVARLMVDIAPLLQLDGFAILTLKLPEPGTAGMDPIAITQEALKTLRTRYRTVRARQLFHNRNEVTAYLCP